MFRSPTGGNIIARITRGAMTETVEYEGSAVRAVAVHGLGGNDVINLRVFQQDSAGRFTNGLSIPSRLCGGDGNDVIFGGEASDLMFGGAGHDWLDGGAGADMLAGQDGDDSAWGGEGDDQILGNEGWDRLDGEGGNDQLFGGAGTDQLRGGTGDDVLFGGAESDWIDGGKGLDSLYGGLGDDRLTGGTGRDSFWCGDGMDCVADLSLAEDGPAWFRGSHDPDRNLVSTLRGDRNSVCESVGNDEPFSGNFEGWFNVIPAGKSS